MAKKFGKFLMTTAALGAFAAGAYYFLTKKDHNLDGDLDEDDDFDDFDEDLDEDDEDRKYVDLDLGKNTEKNDEAEEKADEFKEGINAAKAETTDKIVGEGGNDVKAAEETEADVEEFFDDEDEEYDDSIDHSLDAI